MAAIKDKIIEMISNRKSDNEICNELNISKKMLNYQLQLIKNSGYCLRTNYHSNGIITHSNEIDVDKGKINIKVDGNRELNVLAMSDLHVGNLQASLNLADTLFNFCKVNNIHIIFNCGDIIDGIHGSAKIIEDYNEQIKYFVKNYPHDDEILTFGIIGNHEERIVDEYNFDVAYLINKQRSDVILSNRSQEKIAVASDRIGLTHKKRDIGTRVTFYGHTHQHQISVNPFCTTTIGVPSLSSMGTVLPAALYVKFYFNESAQIQRVEIYHLTVLNSRVEILSSTESLIRKK